MSEYIPKEGDVFCAMVNRGFNAKQTDAAIARIKADALRETANRTYSEGIAGWLRARADEIEKETT